MAKNTLTFSEIISNAMEAIATADLNDTQALETALNFRKALDAFVSEPVEPKVTGKKVKVEQELDLAVPASRDSWFRTLGMNAELDQEVLVGITTKNKQGIVGAVLLVDGNEVARIASENVMEAIFFDGIVKAYTVWKEKGVKDPSADGKSANLGRLPGKEIKKMHEAGISAALIAEQIGREEEAVSEWIAKNC